MKLVEQWERISQGLDPNWGDARLALRIEDAGRCARAAALLGPTGPGRFGSVIRFFTARHGAGVGPEAARRMLKRIDDEGIAGTLELVSSDEAPAPPVTSRRTLAASWDAALAVLPFDWSDLYCEVELSSSDLMDRAALLLAPVNPARHGGTVSYRFRCARSFGYGAAPEMVRRCLARLDESDATGEVRILHALSDTLPVGTQGPVWHVGGRTV